MRFVRGIIAFVMLAIVTAGVSTVAGAQEKKPVMVKIAIVDVRKITAQSEAAKGIRNQIKAYRDVYVGEAQKEEEQLRSAHAELLRKRSVLSPEAFEQERKTFDERVTEVQRKNQERRKALDEAAQVAQDDFQKSVNGVMTEIANENGLTLIFRTDQAVFWVTDLDITDVVLARLNKKMPKIKVPSPGVK